MLRGAALKKSIILSTAIFIFFTCCIPFRISALVNNYASFANDCNYWVKFKYNGNWIYNTVKIANSSDVRAVILHNTTSTSKPYAVYFISKSTFKYTTFWTNVGGTDSWPNTCDASSASNSVRTFTDNGTTYYFEYASISPSSSYSQVALLDNIPVYQIQRSVDNSADNRALVLNYTFGAESTSPDPISYGDLIDVGYSTNLTNSQQSNYLQMRNNKDFITWNGYEDSNGNQINTLEYEVEIQAYATEYEAQTKTGLLGLTLTDLQNYGTPVTIYEGSANRGEFSILWGDVADALNGTSTTIDFWSQMAPHSYENMWYSNGWLYRIRLKTTDDSYVGDWQTIYTMASSPPKDAETVYNYYYYYGGQGLTDDVVDVLYNINTSNNTSNVYYINGNQVDPSGGSSNWLETLLKFISDMIGKILDLFGNMFDSVLDFLLNLFDGFDPVGTFMNWWNRLKQLFNSIDLTLPSFNLTEADISSFSILVQKTIEIFTLNGLGFIIFIPLIVMIVRLFL